MEQAANNCGPEWMESALTTVRWFAKVQHRKHTKALEAGGPVRRGAYSWTMEQARLWAYQHDLPVAKSERAWGAVTRLAVSQGIITATGDYRATASSNGSVRATYIKA
jgi:hypothetical protein